MDFSEKKNPAYDHIDGKKLLMLVMARSLETQ